MDAPLQARHSSNEVRFKRVQAETGAFAAQRLHN